ncbi:MAG: hypothetical protein A2Z14_13715 [Chloroflexi bacterium RBG_16_48_8]|nr:MAG: hypothetical protein A2Z14_13715 [Chloroflexi bacterium RBG_16_48_8]
MIGVENGLVEGLTEQLFGRRQGKAQDVQVGAERWVRKVASRQSMIMAADDHRVGWTAPNASQRRRRDNRETNMGPLGSDSRMRSPC